MTLLRLYIWLFSVLFINFLEILIANLNYFNQSANVNLKPRKRCIFWIYIMLLQSSDTFRKEFVPS
jgi:hypothetical protein